MLFWSLCPFISSARRFPGDMLPWASRCTLMAGYNKQSDMPALFNEADGTFWCVLMDC